MQFRRRKVSRSPFGPQNNDRASNPTMATLPPTNHHQWGPFRLRPLSFLSFCCFSSLLLGFAVLWVRGSQGLQLGQSGFVLPSLHLQDFPPRATFSHSSPPLPPLNIVAVQDPSAGRQTESLHVPVEAPFVSCSWPSSSHFAGTVLVSKPPARLLTITTITQLLPPPRLLFDIQTHMLMPSYCYFLIIKIIMSVPSSFLVIVD
ncbi:hypothetical protein EDD36DRAFT_125350 [Exophiala viscosa]|uniref:Uncharacterized protein n=1 Tax=Exophiala viscosa TaxID=2486360 RepID=A0AAN6E317_9EURO|nr:hypothetical protein EDD36DRAFT_125350 [Exophiala viscosa]